MKSICAHVLGTKSCPFQYCNRGKRAKWKAIHKMPQALDDKNSRIGYSCIQTYYAGQDAAICVEFLRAVVNFFHAECQLPIWEMRFASGPQAWVKFNTETLHRTRHLKFPIPPEISAVGSSRMLPISHQTEVHDFKSFFLSMSNENKQTLPEYFSNSMWHNCQKHWCKTRGYFLACNLCAGSKPMTPDHFLSKEHQRNMRQGKCKDNHDVVVVAWTWHGEEEKPYWEDVYHEDDEFEIDDEAFEGNYWDSPTHKAQLHYQRTLWHSQQYPWTHEPSDSSGSYS